jgi:hypothetical protein
MRELIRSVDSAQTVLDAAVYAGFVTLARVRRRQRPESAAAWERDESSRV